MQINDSFLSLLRVVAELTEAFSSITFPAQGNITATRRTVSRTETERINNNASEVANKYQSKGAARDGGIAMAQIINAT